MLFKANDKEVEHVSSELIENILQISNKYPEKQSLVSMSYNLITAFALNDSLNAFLKGNFLEMLFENLVAKTLEFSANKSNKELFSTQLLISRVIRMLYSVETNKKAIDDYLPAPLIDPFEAIGNFNKNLVDYVEFCNLLNNLKEEVLTDIVKSVRQRKFSNKIGEYTVLESIGRGGFGSIYKVKKGEKVFAMKEIELPGSEQAVLEEEVKEIKVWKDLNHPNIVKYLSCTATEGFLYIVMEFVEGVNLNQYLAGIRDKGQSLSFQEITKIVCDILSALFYLHSEKKVLFRDLHPSNVMIQHDGSVKLVDFGLAKGMNSVSQSAALVQGQFMYTAPEVHNNQPHSEQSDVFSLGCIIYELTALEPAFAGESILEVVNKINNSEYALEKVEDKLFKQIVKECLEKDPFQRASLVEIGAHLSAELVKSLTKAKIENAVLTEENAVLEGKVTKYQKVIGIENEMGKTLKSTMTKLKVATDPLVSCLETVRKLEGLAEFNQSEEKVVLANKFKKFIFTLNGAEMKGELQKVRF